MSILPPDRKIDAFNNRVQAATIAQNRPNVMHMNNNEKIDLPNHIANYSKGFTHDPATGEVDPTEVSLGENGTTQGQDQNTLDVTIGNERMIWPVVNKASLDVERPFFDANASEADQEAAMVQVGTTFTPNMGIDFVHPDRITFDVLASLSGKVTRAEQHPTNGYIIEITHDEDLVTVYQGVADLQVALGDDVKQGTKIAQAGRSEIGSDLGIHLHYQTIKDGKAMNPNLLVIDTQKK